MEEPGIKNWLGFLYLFFDTQVFIKESYDFSKKGKFDLLKKQIDSGKVQLLTGDIVKAEVERHIKEDVSISLGKLQSAFEDRRLAIFREGDYGSIFQSIDSFVMTEYALKIFNNPYRYWEGKDKF